MDARTLFAGLSKDSRGSIDDDELLVRMLERGMAVEEVGALFRALPTDRDKGAITCAEFEAGMRVFPQVIGTTPPVLDEPPFVCPFLTST
jgi:Ca2+-binding EF-hand superfamily protein